MLVSKHPCHVVRSAVQIIFAELSSLDWFIAFATEYVDEGATINLAEMHRDAGRFD